MRSLPALVASLGLACSSPPRAHATDPATSAPPASDATPWAAPPLERAVSCRDGRSGERLAFARVLDELARADVVFLGETHDHEATHRVELAVYEGLLARRDGRVVLALEMFERDVQPVLDAYLAGELDEASFRERARPWGNYASAYRPLIERARRDGLPVVASNFPRPLLRRIGMGEEDLLTDPPPELRDQVPERLLANTPLYWRRVDNAIRGHAAMMGGPPSSPEERLTSTQSLWDNAMGEACADALAQHPGWLVLHVNGGFHSAYRDGTARQLALRAPDARVRTVDITPATNPAVAELSGLPVADVVVFAEERANDPDEGLYSVALGRELRYRLHLPDGASAEHPAPLLVWLPDDGATVDEELALWRRLVGDESALLVLEPPWRAAWDDRVEAGRWFWADTFAEDVGAASAGIQRAWAYVLRHFPVDPERVVLAGEGTGATVAAVAALFADRMPLAGLAFAPRRYAKIGDLPLPLPELRGDDPPPRTSLELWLAPEDEGWWQGELAQYAAIGFASSARRPTDDPWHAALERENALRAALGLPAHALPADAPRRHAVVHGARARRWARLAALARAPDALVAVLDAPPPDDAGSTPLDLAIDPAALTTDGALPRCPGAFGGTTVIVVDEARHDAEPWHALEEDDPLARTSRFHRVRIATRAGERALPVVLEELAAANRTNVLVLPATFCADGESMRALARLASPFEDRMTLHWRPGLGAPGE